MEVDKKIKEFLKDQSALIVGPNQTDRVAWKKILIDLGVLTTSIHAASDYTEAITLLEEHRPPFVISEYEIQEETLQELIKIHTDIFPNKQDRFFFVVSSFNSLTFAANMAEYEVDGLIIRPYVVDDFIKQVCKAIKNNLEMPQSKKDYYLAIKHLHEDDTAEALKIADHISTQDPASHYAELIKGLIAFESNNLKEACEFFKQVLEKNEHHHTSLVKLFEIYMQNKQYALAQDIAQEISENYPVAPARVPDFLRCSLATGKYENLISFSQMILENKGELVQLGRPIAAGLAISAQWLAKKSENRDLALNSALKAISLSDRHMPIFTSALKTLYSLKEYQKLQEYLDETPTSEMSLDLHELQIRIMNMDQSKDKEQFEYIQKILTMGLKSKVVYEHLLPVAERMGKDPDYLKELKEEMEKAP